MPSYCIFRVYRYIPAGIFARIIRSVLKIINCIGYRLDEDWPAKAAMTH